MVTPLKNNTLRFYFLSSEHLHFAFPFLKQKNTQHLRPEHVFFPGNHKEQALEEPVQFSTHVPTKSVGQTHRTVSHQLCVCIGLYSSSPKKKCETKLVEVNTCIILWVYQEQF